MEVEHLDRLKNNSNIDYQKKTGAALTMRPVRLEPHHFLRFTIRDHFLKSPKYAIKINAKKIYPPEPHQNFKGCAATASEAAKLVKTAIENLFSFSQTTCA